MSKICSFRIENKRVKITRLSKNRLRFRCIRCAKLCCKLGGPRLTKDDFVRFEKLGFGAEEISDSRRVLNRKSNGECIFLSFNQDNTRYECQIYEHRPLLCKVFPFFVEPEIANDKYTLVVLPCRGLSMSKGRLVSGDYIQNTLSPILLAVIGELGEFQGSAKS